MAMPTEPTSSSSRLPTLSTSAMATNVTATLTTPLSTERSDACAPSPTAVHSEFE